MIYGLFHTLTIKFFMLFLFWIPEVVERKKFELKNKKSHGSQSFKKSGIKADLCFEFSSEGEFAQVHSLIEDALKEGRKLELVFFSPSVEKQIISLYESYPDQIRYLRYPLVSFNFFSKTQCFTQWVTSSVLYLVRYDFFPEFLFWAQKKNHELKLIWLSFKKTRLKNKELSFIKKKFLSSSALNVFATAEDKKFAENYQFSGMVYDFRMEQIYRRKLQRENKLARLLPHYPLLINHLRLSTKNFILGNSWVSDLHLLQGLAEGVSLLIVPHQLDNANLVRFSLELDKLGLDSQVIDESSSEFNAPILILNQKGVLCELYSDFSHAYVGGGFGVSVHSLLEPLVGGVPNISCGPINHRSSEFDVAKSYKLLQEVHNHHELNSWLLTHNESGLNFDSSQYLNYRKEVIGC